MTLRTTLTLLLALAALASCVAANDPCAGWSKITTDHAETVEWLGAHDPAFLRQVTAHDESGAAQRCW